MALNLTPEEKEAVLEELRQLKTGLEAIKVGSNALQKERDEIAQKLESLKGQSEETDGFIDELIQLIADIKRMQ